MTSARVLRFLSSSALTWVLLATAAGCTPAPGPVTAPSTTRAGDTSATPAQSEPTTPSATPARPQPDVELTLLAGGDILPHGPVNDSATRPDGIDYSPLLSGLDRWVSSADLALCHLEVPVAPPGVEPSGYPVFAAPRELVRDLGEQGWDGCSTASNHSADAGYDGITATLGALDQAGMGHVGTARDRREARRPQYYELHRGDRTVTVAHLATTYGLNGLTPPRGDWSVDVVDTGRIAKQARAARAAGADLVVVSLHDGHEYVTEPTPHQQDVTRALARSRQVDLVIGHHAHVPQPITRLRGGPEGDGMWVSYGLGNLLSNQGPGCCGGTASAVGLLLVADVVQPPEGRARVTDVRWAATTVDLAAGHRLRATRDALARPGRGRLSETDLRERLEIARDAAGTTADEQRRPSRPAGEPPLVVPRAR
ncbi:CapA family protein [Promicromonospora iranensis]|uniref:Poly-gamma-glutamate synthesis protein (Capsule biosynthesis protein) n=1 Tax=Promicromonospora iranensis TaxID=1105144 RepID=A0ABU2CJH0_9MICO|nr:CapA family protein [Promicromonospora iranensis]MDR7381466.1 poly-gamma-glutamate synthesis protein (capsule biosynthesis protein) [Promicromonospora iranensis]